MGEGRREVQGRYADGRVIARLARGEEGESMRVRVRIRPGADIRSGSVDVRYIALPTYLKHMDSPFHFMPSAPRSWESSGHGGSIRARKVRPPAVGLNPP